MTKTVYAALAMLCLSVSLWSFVASAVYAQGEAWVCGSPPVGSPPVGSPPCTGAACSAEATCTSASDGCACS